MRMTKMETKSNETENETVVEYPIWIYLLHILFASVYKCTKEFELP